MPRRIAYAQVAPDALIVSIINAWNRMALSFRQGPVARHAT
jgi:hypothetical protein